MKWLSAMVALVLLFSACRKQDTVANVTSGKITVNIAHNVDGSPLLFDTICFQNAAGNQYGIERLQYYVSRFRFYSKGTLLHTSNKVAYIDARYDSSSSFSIDSLAGMPVGKYDSVAFLLGIDSQYNKSHALPATFGNIAMGWPDEMGGGYHFLKLEGHWQDAGAISGYAMHIGSNGYQVETGIRCDLQIATVANSTLAISMNINEWFRQPHTYNFNTDGVFTMGDTTLMRKLSDNGRDVFRGF